MCGFGFGRLPFNFIARLLLAVVLPFRPFVENLGGICAELFRKGKKIVLHQFCGATMF